jgi:hypothetical protein
MKFFRAVFLNVSVFAIIMAITPQSDAASWKWDFEGDPAGKPPGGFTFGRTGSGHVGRWAVQAVKDAPSGTKVLAQLDTDATSYRFPSPSRIPFRSQIFACPCAAKLFPEK